MAQDSMSLSPVSVACVSSDGFEFCLRDSERLGVDVFVRRPDGGEITCESSRRCTVAARFDGGAPVELTGSQLREGGAEQVSLRPVHKILLNLRGARRLELDLAKGGEPPRTTPFDIHGLERDRFSQSGGLYDW
ncbi:hypothetical protein [Caulobacter flavus]|uniref:hypothetical protein n=1 Tax=Caulobacter flavus TaxID=1679497 RepID=UPI0013DE4F0F|nr:hypothetical protein [Caulobacter flavus]